MLYVCMIVDVIPQVLALKHQNSNFSNFLTSTLLSHVEIPQQLIICVCCKYFYCEDPSNNSSSDHCPVEQEMNFLVVINYFYNNSLLINPLY